MNRRYYLEKLSLLLTGPLSLENIKARIESEIALERDAWEHDRVLSSRGRTIRGEAEELLQVISAWHSLVTADAAAELAKIPQGG